MGGGLTPKTTPSARPCGSPRPVTAHVAIDLARGFRDFRNCSTIPIMLYYI